MRSINKVLTTVLMAASVAALSTNAMAEPKGEAVVKEAIENTLSGIAAAQVEITERQRQKATDILKAARKSVEAGDAVAAETGLATALKSFSEMKATYDKTH